MISPELCISQCDPPAVLCGDGTCQIDEDICSDLPFLSVISMVPTVTLITANGTSIGSIDIILNGQFPGVSIIPNSALPPPSDGGTILSPPEDIILLGGQSSDLIAVINLALFENSTQYADDNHLCLGFYNVNASPPDWECLDSCVSVNRPENQTIVSASSPHLTSFAVLLSFDANTTCGYDWTYLIASLSLIGFFFSLAIIICCFPPASRHFYGVRNMQMRESRHVLSYASTSSAVDVKDLSVTVDRTCNHLPVILSEEEI